MKNTKYDFIQNNRSIWRQQRDEFLKNLDCLISNGMLHKIKHDFQIEIKNIKQSKTQRQLGGIHRLFKILVPYFQGAWGTVILDENDVKEHVKILVGYSKTINGVTTPKSFKDITKEEMNEIIERTLHIGQEIFDIPNFELVSYEVQEMEKYFSNNN